MRGFFILTLVALAIAGTNQQISTVNICLNQTNRAALQARFGSNLTLLNNPVNSNQCTNEFSVYGSCCDPVSLINTTNNLATQLTNSLKIVKTAFTNYVQSINDLRQYIVTIANRPIEQNDVEVQRSTQAAKDALADPFLGPFLTNHNQSLALAFNFTYDQCWPRAAALRESALCAQCSARSNSFQADNSGQGRLILNDTECDSIYQVCNQAIERTAAFIQDLDFTFDLLPSLSSAFSLTNNFSVVVNRGKVRRFASIINDDTFFANLQQARTGNSKARSNLCALTLSAGEPLFPEFIATLFNKNANFFVDSIEFVTTQGENAAFGQVSRLDNLTRTLQGPFPTNNVPSNFSKPLDIYAFNNTNSTARIPPVPFSPIFRRRLQGVNNTSPGNLGINVIKRSEYDDEQQRVSNLLERASNRRIITRNFFNPPSPLFSIAGRTFGASVFSTSTGVLDFATQDTANAFVNGRPFGQLRPYDFPPRNGAPDFPTFVLGSFIRLFLPSTLNPRST